MGALDCAVEPHDEKQGVTKYKIRKVVYSSNGPMVDIFAPADRTLSAGYANNETYQRQDNSSFYDRYFDGTSSASPNTCSVIALYLESNRGSSQSAIRTWLTGTACKNNLMSDPYPSEGNTSSDDLTNGYWARSYNALLDAASIINTSYNVGGTGNLRDAPNRVLFNPLTTPDTTAPTLVSTVPADGATGVAVSANLVLNFSETVIAQNNKNIVIKKSVDDSTVETISVTSNRVTGSNSSQITVNPSSNLDTNTSYYVLIDSASFEDAAGNSYAGISDPTTLNFTTAAADTTPPTLVSTVPATNATGVAINANIVFNFSEAVTAQSGFLNFINIYKFDTTLVESIAATNSKVTGSGTNQITVNPTSDLAENTTFYVNIGSDAFDDAAGNSFAGVSDSTTIRFTTGTGSDPDPDPPVVDGEFSLRFFGNGLTLNGQLVIT